MSSLTSLKAHTASQWVTGASLTYLRLQVSGRVWTYIFKQLTEANLKDESQKVSFTSSASIFTK